MLLDQIESRGAQKGRRIDQFPRFDPRRESEKSIHRRQPRSSVDAAKAIRRDAEIGQEPDCLWRCRASKASHDISDSIFRKTIENEMGDDQIVRWLGWRPRCDVALKKSNTIEALGQLALDPSSRQTQHLFAGVHAIDFNSWMPANQLAEESSIPLAQDEDAAGGVDFFEAGHPGPLQSAPERDRFQRPIPRRDGVEA